MRNIHLLGLGTVLAGAIFAFQAAESLSSNHTTFQVFDSVASCVSAKGQEATTACTDMEAEARSVADNLLWPFADRDECVASHGAAGCYQGQDNRWRVKMAGFTQFSRDTAFRSILPVFSSSKYPGIYLPNGYPVLSGENTILDAVLAVGGDTAGQPRSLAKDLCVVMPGYDEATCRPLHAFVSRGRLELPTVAALFSVRP